jgi:stage II sporulation protein M
MNKTHKILSFYKEEVKKFKELFLPNFYFSVGIFLIGAIIAVMYYINDPEGSIRIVKEIAASMDKKGLDEDNSLLLAIKIFSNNVQVALLILFLGLIPLIPIGLLVCLSNGAILGIVAMVFYGLTHDPLLLSASLLPHGMIELPIIFYTAAISMVITKKVTNAILNRKDPVKITFKEMALTLFAVIIPLLMIAALIESFITPLFMGI